MVDRLVVEDPVSVEQEEEEETLLLAFRRFAKPFPTWIDISAVFPTTVTALGTVADLSSAATSSMEHWIPMVHFSGIVFPQVQVVWELELSSSDLSTPPIMMGLPFFAAFLRGRYL